MREIEEKLFGTDELNSLQQHQHLHQNFHNHNKLISLSSSSPPTSTSSFLISGNNNNNNKQQQSNVNLINTISEIEQKIKSITIGKEKFNHCYSELKKLEKWITTEGSDLLLSSLEPSAQLFSGSGSSISSSLESSKFEEILAFEDEIKADGEAAEQINHLESFLLNSGDNKNSQLNDLVPQLEPELNELKLELLESSKQVKDLENEIRAVIEQTYLWFSDLAFQLNELNIDLSELERKREESKYD